MPSGLNVSHGFDALNIAPPLASVPPVHSDVLVAVTVVQVAPPSELVALTIPRDAAFDHRSCCQTETRFCSFAGLTARNGSTSLLE
jgi:hypothetical protein